MKYLYLLLDLSSLSVPFLYSFHPKLKLYKDWKSIGLALFSTMFIFIPWDAIFTSNGFWGFNEAYYLDYRLLGLPIEEWLFFICIPYACIFTFYALLYYFPNLGLSAKNTKIISLLIAFFLVVLGIVYHDRWYTFTVSVYALFCTLAAQKWNPGLLAKFYPIFVVILLPFFLINGTLTGSFIVDEVVWYNNDENIGLRLFTIPVEDTIYAFALLLTNLFLVEFFKKRLFRK
ncbi:lycopene cyclase domain-containing protein [Kriegella aquimaris]|uniref:Lycopene cyclase domain-containing protein n=1 Tax=Kriegella aquimaris TaxID=192904 RepID=A0A1G9UHN2_9FLAO|nr:lycopene cyclase domain-containing protein [Kriegella aquimaris]SDM59353.1 lycopene cyclase domain-containing protein [Kriegella aquimaris]